jgi:predicted MFS family arabinose efflux permease
MADRVPDATTVDLPVSERAVLLLVGAVQFVNILDFMILAPLGPRVAKELHMYESQLPDATAAYTFAGGVAGIVGSFFLDRFERRKALALAALGLAAGTAAGGFATDLVFARMLAGMFGGPATSLAIAVIADVIPLERRGRAMGAIMGAFAAASVLGVPMGIMLAEHGGFRVPLFVVAGMGVCVAAATFILLPTLRGHLTRTPTHHPSTYWEMLRRPAVIASYTMTAAVNGGFFVLIPNISVFVMNNLHLPERQLKWMYLAGGVVSLVTARFAGRYVDRVGAFRVGTVGTVLQMIIVYATFATALLPIEGMFLGSMYGMFMFFMLSNSMRTVALQTLTSKVPYPEERARFQSLQSSVQHLSSALGASLSARLLTTNENHELVGMPLVAYVALGGAALLPFLMRRVERLVKVPDPR